MRLLLALALLPGCGKVFVSDTDVLTLYDQDHDGFYAPEATAVGVDGPYDCDDGEPAVHPGADDPCDGVDNDCDGTADNGAESLTFAYDADHDGYGDDGNVRHACVAPDGFVALGGDCDDGDGDVHPEAIEVCDGVDDDCDGATDADDDDLADGTVSWQDADHDGYGDAGSPVTACGVPDGYVDDDQDCDDADPDVRPGAVETCDGVDDDCDGDVDDDDAGVTGTSTWYLDADADTYGGAVTTNACVAPAGYVATSGDCHDDDGAAHPGAAEYCGTYDYDCDGNTDEADSLDVTDIYEDDDGDGYGAASTAAVGCAVSGWTADGTDCADGDSSIHPGAAEICSDDNDDDCDGGAAPCRYVAGHAIDASGFASYAISGVVSASSAPSAYAIDVDKEIQVFAWPPSAPLTSATTIVNDVGVSSATGSVAFGNYILWSEDSLAISDDDGTVYIVETPSTTTSLADTTGTVRITGAGTQIVAYPSSVFEDGVLVGWPAQGTACVIDTWGKSVGSTYSAASIAQVSASSSTSGDEFGGGLAFDDVDGDGVSDFVVGAPADATSTGAVYAWTGGSSSVDTSSADAVLVGSGKNGRFGDVLRTSDVDGDGYVDLLVGAPSDDSTGLRDAGAVFVFAGPVASGGPGAAMTSLLGAASSDGLGEDLAFADLDWDGADEIYAASAVGVFGWASPSGSLSRTSADFAITGTGATVTMLASPGDIDADREDDLILANQDGFWVLDRQQY